MLEKILISRLRLLRVTCILKCVSQVPVNFPLAIVSNSLKMEKVINLDYSAMQYCHRHFWIPRSAVWRQRRNDGRRCQP